MVAFIIDTLRSEGHVVVQAYDVLSATNLASAIEPCDLVISDARFLGVDGVDLIVQLRRRRPTLPILYLANLGRSTPETERRLPAGVPILREPFTAEDLRALVRALLPARWGGPKTLALV